MRRSPRQTGQRAVGDSALAAVAAAEADAGAITIRSTQPSRVNRAGSFLVSWKQPDAESCGPAPLAKKLRRNCECHEEDQLILNAKKNSRGNKNSARRPSAGYSENRKSRKASSSTRCRNCGSMRRRRPRCSASAPRTNPVRRKGLRPAARSATRCSGKSPISRKERGKWGTHFPFYFRQKPLYTKTSPGKAVSVREARVFWTKRLG